MNFRLYIGLFRGVCVEFLFLVFVRETYSGWIRGGVWE